MEISEAKIEKGENAQTLNGEGKAHDNYNGNDNGDRKGKSTVGKHIKQAFSRAASVLTGCQVVACGVAAAGMFMYHVAVAPQYPLFPMAGLAAAAMAATGVYALKLMKARRREVKAEIIALKLNRRKER